MSMPMLKGASIFAKLLNPTPELLAIPELKKLILPSFPGAPGHLLGHNELCPGFSTLVARLCLDSSEPDGGLTYCAVGSGDPLWNPLEKPPAATGDETTMASEFARKPWANRYFVDEFGTPRTVSEAIAQNLNTVDFEVIFAEGEAVGNIMEIGIWGGDATAALGSGTLCDYETLERIPKPTNARLSFIFRWQF